MEAIKWRFRGEGNASLVLINTEEKRVYRFPKYTHWGKGHFISSEKSKAERVHEELQLVVDYMSHVMQPLLSSSFVVLPELSLIPAGLTEEAETQIQVSRPAQRKGKDVEPITIDASTISALVLPDLCYIKNNQSKCSAPTLSIEIKPKKAFMHTRDSLSDVSDELSQVCKFCMHQRLKAKEGQWPNTSRYCPLDLFSGDRQRMKHALLALAETPQNNLRICQNGEEIHGAWNKEDLIEIFDKFFGNWRNGFTNGLRRQQALHTFLDLVLEALLYVPVEDKENEQPVPDSSSHPVQYCKSSQNLEQLVQDSSSQHVQYCQTSTLSQDSEKISDCCELPVGCVLERVLTAQRLDALDIHGVFPLYQHIDKYLRENPAERSNLCLDGPYTEADWLSQCTDSNCDQRIFKSHITDTYIRESVQKVKKFLVSKTVQDCSIMVALQALPNSVTDESVYIMDPYEGRYSFSVSIIDLDPKPFCKIPTYHTQDREIVNAYKEFCRRKENIMQYCGVVD